MAPGQGLHGLITVYDELTHKQPLGEGFTLGVHWAKLNHCKTSSADSNEAHQMRLKRLSVQYERANLNLVVPGWHNSKKNDDDDDGLIWQFEDVLDERLRQLRKDPQDKDSGPYFMIGFAGGLSFGGGSEDTVRRSVARINTTFPSADVQDEALAKAIFRLPTQQLTSDDYLDSLKKLLLSRANERVLFISACPRGEILIRTDTEYRDIKKRIDQSTHRSSIKLALELSSSVKAMSNALRKHKPTILHFSGHARADGLCFEDENGNLDLIQTGSLTELMRQGRKFGLHTVILNACYTADQSDCIARIVGRVVAMPGVIKDEEAIMFSEGFYDSIGEGYGPDEAFDWGDAQLRTHNVPLERHPLIKHRAGLRAEATVPALPEPDNAFDSESEPEFEPAPGSNSHSEHARQTLSATKKTAQRKGECKTPQAEKPNIPTTTSSPSTDSMESDDACSTDDTSAPSTPTTEVDGRARATDVKKTEPQSSARPEPAQGLSMIEFLKLRSKIDSQKTSNNTAPKPRPAANTARPAPNGAPNANPAPDRPSAFQPTCNSKPQTACPSHRPATGTPSGRTTCDPKMADLLSSCHPRSSYYPCSSSSSCDDKFFAFLLSEVLTAQPSASTRAGPSRSRMRLQDCDCCGNVLPLEEGGYVCETCSKDRKQILACVRCAGRLLCRFAGHKVVRVRYQT